MSNFKNSVINDNLTKLMCQIQNEIRDKVLSIFIDKIMKQNKEIIKLKKDCDRYYKKAVQVLKKLIKIEDEKEKKVNLTVDEKLELKLLEINSSRSVSKSNSNLINNSFISSEKGYKKEQKKVTNMKLENNVLHLKKDIINSANTKNNKEILYSPKSFNPIKYFSPISKKLLFKNGSQELKIKKNKDYDLSVKKKLKFSKNLTKKEQELSRNTNNNIFELNDTSNSIYQNSSISGILKDNLFKTKIINNIDNNISNNKSINSERTNKKKRKNLSQGDLSKIIPLIPVNIKVNIDKNNNSMKKISEKKNKPLNDEKFAHKNLSNTERILKTISENNKKGIKTNPLHNSNLYTYLEKLKK